jgi:hypothetical protein
MSRNFVANVTYFLDDKGNLRENLSKKSKKLAETMGAIITSTTLKPSPNPQTTLTCSNLVQKKRCTGAIDASIELSSFAIIWHCLHCGHHGSIYNWVNTIWDGGHR